jgi:hypothetical protein
VGEREEQGSEDGGEEGFHGGVLVGVIGYWLLVIG